MALLGLSKIHEIQHHLVGSHFQFDKEHSSLYIIQSLRAFALSMVGIFLPIYIFNISDQYLIFHHDKIINGLLWGVTYFMLRSLGTVVNIYFFANFIFQKVRMDRSIFISNIIEILEILLWLLAKQNLYFMILAGFLAGLKVTFFWLPYHIFFVKKFEEKKYGTIMAKRNALQNVFSALSPVIGGIVISTMGYNVLFSISMFILFVSGFLATKNINDWKHDYHDLNKITKKFLFNKKYFKLNLAFLGESIDLSIFTIFWPILLFVILNNFVRIGMLTSLTIFLASLTTIISGKLLDKHGSKIIHGIGILVNSLLYIPRVTLLSPLWIYIIDIVDKLNGPFYSLPNMALSYEKAKRSDSSSEFIIHREFMVHTGIVLSCGFLILVLMNSSTWRWTFLLAALGSLLTYFIDLDSN